MIDFLDKDREKVELISDDFQSIFSVAAINILVNMMGSSDKENLTNIIKKHLGNVSVQFHKTGQLGEKDYDIYAIIVDANQKE